ncbi:hypothetical protein F5879DRAFT_990594 [Lentinula edodes]|nr:hypothetical protein F5879DRAFT_990594 [Lentinula edodes]
MLNEGVVHVEISTGNLMDTGEGGGIGAMTDSTTHLGATVDVVAEKLNTVLYDEINPICNEDKKAWMRRIVGRRSYHETVLDAKIPLFQNYVRITGNHRYIIRRAASRPEGTRNEERRKSFQVLVNLFLWTDAASSFCIRRLRAASSFCIHRLRAALASQISSYNPTTPTTHSHTLRSSLLLQTLVLPASHISSTSSTLSSHIIPIIHTFLAHHPHHPHHPHHLHHSKPFHSVGAPTPFLAHLKYLNIHIHSDSALESPRSTLIRFNLCTQGMRNKEQGARNEDDRKAHKADGGV